MESVILGMEDETIELNSKLQHEPSIRVTEREVWEAANSLWAKKIDPSPNKVRELLGNRGSFRTIQLYLKTWRRQQIEQPALDDPLWQELSKMRKKVEQQAKSTANSQIQAIQQECDAKLLEMQALQHLAEQERDIVKQQLQEQQSYLNNLKTIHTDLVEKFNEQEKKLVSAECAKQLLDKQLYELKISSEKQLNTQSHEHQKEIDILNKQIRYNENQYQEKLNNLSNKYEEQKSLLEKNITELFLKNSDLNFQLKLAKENEAQHQVNIKSINNKYTKLLSEINLIKNQNAILLEKLHQKDKELAIMEVKLNESTLVIQNLRSQHQEVQEKALYYNQIIGQLKEKIAALKNSNMQNNEIFSDA